MGFHFLAPGSVPESEARFAATLDGAQLLAKQVDLDFVRGLGRLDFVVTGACAVDPRTGVRFGKGHGFFDTEWGILSELGVVDERDAGRHLRPRLSGGRNRTYALSSHDTAGDWILTPTRSIQVPERHPNPSGIRWELVDDARLAEIEPLRQLDNRRRTIDQHRAVKGQTSPGDPARSHHLVHFRRQHLSARRSGPALARSLAPTRAFTGTSASFIADFEGSDICSQRLRGFESWTGLGRRLHHARQQHRGSPKSSRLDDKTCLMTTYGIRRGFLVLDPNDVPANELAYAATLDGMDHYGRPVDLDEVAKLGHIGLLVTGGSAVNHRGPSHRQGSRLFRPRVGVLSEVGSTDESTEIVDIVHDCQVVDLELAARSTTCASTGS